MVNIKSDKKEIHSPAGIVFSFLSDFNNFQDLMPEQIVNWKSENDSCSFTIKGMSDINMKIKEKICLIYKSLFFMRAPSRIKKSGHIFFQLWCRYSHYYTDNQSCNT